MSLARLALRIATVKALCGKTFAGAFVRDSEIGPIDETIEDAEVPFIVVYTDDTDGDPVGAGEETSLFTGRTAVALTLEIGVTTRMKGQWGLPTTDAGMEWTIDAIERQIRLALADPDDSWAELWRRLVHEIKAQKSSRGASARQGVRFAGRQIVITAYVMCDPLPGRAPSGLWQSFLALIAADASLAPQSVLLTSLVTGGATDWADLKALRAVYGYTQGVGAALMFAPPAAAAPDAPVFAGDAPGIEVVP